MKLIAMMTRYCMYKVCEGIHLTTTTAKDGFDGVLELMFFTDSDHGGNADGSSTWNDGVCERQLFPRLLEWAEVLITLNTAESE